MGYYVLDDLWFATNDPTFMVEAIESMATGERVAGGDGQELTYVMGGRPGATQRSARIDSLRSQVGSNASVVDLRLALALLTAPVNQISSGNITVENVTEAVRALDRASAAYPDNCRVPQLRGAAAHLSDDWERAAKEYRNAWERHGSGCDLRDRAGYGHHGVDETTLANLAEAAAPTAPAVTESVARLIVDVYATDRNLAVTKLTTLAKRLREAGQPDTALRVSKVALEVEAGL